jgi:O-antigen biosynthesis protein WbqP
LYKLNFYFFYKRLIDIFLSLFFITIFIIPFLIILLIFIFTKDINFIHWSKRIGIRNRIFKMPKIRTMKLSTPDLATHLLNDNQSYVTKFGKILRKTSLDEIPQLYSVLVGDMTLVGPRPALFNQYDLIKYRTNNNIHSLKPGITGWAQIKGRDNLSIEEKVKYDSEYLMKMSIFFDLKILFITVLKILKMRDVSH